MSDASYSTATPRRRSTDRLSDAQSLVVQGNHTGWVDADVIEAVPLRSARHDPSFLTHLIAMAERCPQTRVLRRATPEDAMAAYRAADAKDHTISTGSTTRQNI